MRHGCARDAVYTLASDTASLLHEVEPNGLLFWLCRRHWLQGIEATAAHRGRYIDRPPNEYLKAFYDDIVNFDPPAVRLALHFAGEDRIRAGSDYPHHIGAFR
jgi:hypothetical protein